MPHRRLDANNHTSTFKASTYFLSQQNDHKISMEKNCVFGHPLVKLNDYKLLIDRHLFCVRLNNRNEKRDLYTFNQPLDIFPDLIRKANDVLKCFSNKAGSEIKIALCDLSSSLQCKLHTQHLINGP